MLYLALACLQGRPQQDAWSELWELEPDGIQLTPGNVPTDGFEELVAGSGRPVRFHHGFAWRQRRRRPWPRPGRALTKPHPDWSVHPPSRHEWTSLDDVLSAALTAGLILETMPPACWLGEGDELVAALNAGVPLAVDVAHLFLQLEAGKLTRSVLHRVLDSDAIAEVHVSQNDGRGDLHEPLQADAFGLGWARERLAAGTPVILESYFHRIDTDERRRQLELLRGDA
ncbi:MAG: hypothetical protein AAF533_26780 [Acidobacteriota bacterium]